MGAWTAGSAAVFSAGTDGAFAFTVTVDANTSATTVLIDEGTPTFSVGSGFTLTSTGGFSATTAGSALNIGGLGNTTISGAIANSIGALTKTGAGTLTLSGTNAYTGVTAINGGTLALGSAGALGSGTNKITFGGGTLQHSATNTTDYSSRFDGSVASQSYSIDTNGRDVTYATALTSSGATLAKSGAGTLTLSGVNTYSGTTTINAGALNVSGSLAGAVSVASGGTLGGSGSVGATTLNSGGSISPGSSSIGTLSLASLTFNGGSTLNLTLGTGGASDKLAIAGAFTQGTVGQYTIDFGNSGESGTTYTLATFSSSTFNSGADFTFANLAPGVSGSFALSGSDLTFVTTAIPEPSTYAAILGIGALGFVVYRRRQARSTAAAVTTEV